MQEAELWQQTCERTRATAATLRFQALLATLVPLLVCRGRRGRGGASAPLAFALGVALRRCGGPLSSCFLTHCPPAACARPRCGTFALHGHCQTLTATAIPERTCPLSVPLVTTRLAARRRPRQARQRQGCDSRMPPGRDPAVWDGRIAGPGAAYTLPLACAELMNRSDRCDLRMRRGSAPSAAAELPTRGASTEPDTAAAAARQTRTRTRNAGGLTWALMGALQSVDARTTRTTGKLAQNREIIRGVGVRRIEAAAVFTTGQSRAPLTAKPNVGPKGRVRRGSRRTAGTQGRHMAVHSTC